MDLVNTIFGEALREAVREKTAPQGVDAVVSPSVPVPAVSAGEDASAVAPAEVKQTEPMCRMADLVTSAMRRNVSFRDNSGVSARLQYALDANTCRFTDEQIAALSTVVPPSVARKMFTPLTFTKTRSAKSLFVDVVNSVKEPLFEALPSPYPDVPKSVEGEVYASMERDIVQIFAALDKIRGGAPLSPDEEQAIVQLIAMAPQKRADDILSRRKEFANARARRMQDKIWDIFVEGGGEKALADCISNLCMYGTCFLVGPVPRVVAQNRCREDEKSGVRRYTREFKLKPVFEALNPIDCYPAPDAKQPSDGPFCIREKYTAETLWRFSDGGATREKNGEGWNEAVVRALLDRYPRGGVKFNMEPEDVRKQEAEMNKGAGTSEDCTFEAVRCFLSVRGSDLAEIGIVRNRDGRKIVLGDFYHVEAIVIDDKVVYCRILDARFDVPISKACFYELPGSFWGESIADKLAFVQMMQNNTGKALFLDLAATGPMIWINNAQRLLDKSPAATQWSPYKTVAFGDELYTPSGANGAPMGILDIPTKAAQLIREWDQWQTQADNDSGIPRFAEGQTSGAMGALRTSGGLAQMSEHMMRNVKMVATQYDGGIVKPTMQRIADWILVFDDDMDLKGDVYIRPVGMIGRILRAQLDDARMRFLQIVSGNPHLQQLFGPKLELALGRHIVRSLDFNADAYMPSEEHARWMEELNKVAALAAAEQQAANAQQGGDAGASPEGGAPQAEQAPMPGGVAERRAVA